MMDEVFIGREKECALIADLMKQKKNIFVFGKEGVGKSAIILKILGKLEPKNYLYSKASRTLKEALVALVAFDAGLKRNPRKQTISSLKRQFYRILEKGPEYIVLDHVGWVEPKYYSLLEYLLDRAVPLLILGRGVEKKFIGHLWMALYTFEKVEISNLDKWGAEGLITHYLSISGLQIANEDNFKRDVFRISKGNPKVIKQLCFLARDKKYRTKGYADVALMDLDRRITNVTMDLYGVTDNHT